MQNEQTEQLKLSDNWHWHFHNADADILSSWFEKSSSWELVKSNPVRKVFRCTADNGQSFYVKVAKRSNFLVWTFPVFRHEFEMARTLSLSSLPCVEIPVWGYGNGMELLISRGIDNTQTLAEFISYNALSKEEKSELLSKLARLVSAFWKSGFYHGDFHLGNILIDNITEQLCIIDLHAIKQRPWYLSRQKCINNMCKKLLARKSNPIFSDEQLFVFLQECGFATNKESAANLLANIRKTQKKYAESHFNIRYKKILKGEYFNTTIIEWQGMKTYVKLNASGKPMEFHPEIPENTRRMPHNQAVEFWPREVLTNPKGPVAWIVTNDTCGDIIVQR